MSSLYWIFVGVLSLTSLIWMLNLLQLALRTRDRNRYRLRAQTFLDAPREGPLVSVVIPARNEAGNIGDCIAHVLNQSYESIEVLVLNDRSEDATAEEANAALLGDPRGHILDGTDRPDGWMGKVWACHTAQQKAQGEWLLFIDADVRLMPEAIRQSVHYLQTQELGALSIFGQLTMNSFWEWVVQPVIGGLILQNNDPADVNDPDKKDKVMANGQFILATRSAYDAAGGHESIRGEILDDVEFARRCKTDNIPFHVVYGRELFSCRMYTSLREIWEGWTKNLFAGLHYNLGLALTVCVVLFTLNLFPILMLPVSLIWHPSPTDPLFLLALGNILAMYTAYVAGLITAQYSPKYFWSYPLGMLVTIGLFANSARQIASGRGVSWKGRRYTHTGEGQNPVPK